MSPVLSRFARARAAIAIGAVIAGFAVGSFAIIEHDIGNHERQLLHGDAQALGSTLLASVTNLQSSLSSIGNVASLTAMSPQAFATEAQSLKLGPGTAIALVSKQDARMVVTLAYGSGLTQGQAITGDAATTIGEATGTVMSTPVITDGHYVTIGFALGAPYAPPGTAVYEQARFVPYIPAITANKAYGGLNIVIRDGKGISSSNLILSTVRHLPLSDPVGSTSFKVGSATWVVYVSSPRPVVGALTAAVPWFVLGVGIVAALSIALVVRRLTLRRAALEAKSGELAQALATIDTAYEREAELRDEVALGQRLSSLGNLAGGIAHDFNNLLTVISNSARLVVEALEDFRIDHDPHRLFEAEGDVDQIIRSTDRAARITGQFLTFAGRSKGSKSVIDLQKVVTDMLDLVGEFVGTSITVSTQFSPNLHAIHADPTQIEQLILNFAANARDAMPSGGTLSIHASNAGSDDESRFISLVVSDTGVGMTKEVANHVFDPFYTTKPVGTGTGIGLSVVHGIVANLGGQIRVESQLGKGTTFTIRLPGCEEHAQIAAGEADEKVESHGQTVLVVEDEEMLLNVTQRILTKNGFHVLTAANGGEAIELAHRHTGPIGVLLTDVRMPGMSGVETAQRIREAHPETGVVFMSGYAGDTPGRDTLGKRADEVWLGKPFSPAQVLAAVTSLVSAEIPGSATGAPGTPGSTDSTKPASQ